MLTALKNSITTVIKEKTADNSITPATLGALLDAIADVIQKDVAFAQVIPFTSMNTLMAATAVSGALTFTPSTSGALPWASTGVRLTANGTNTPAFAGFKKSNASKDWTNTSGAINVLIFWFDGTEYWYSIYQAVAGTTPPPGDTVPPVISSAATQSPTNIALYMNEAMGSTSTAGHSITIAGVASTITNAVVSANSQIILTVSQTITAGQAIVYSYDPSTGNTTDAAGNELAAVSNYSVTNNVGGGGDTTAPTVTAAETQSAYQVLVTISEGTIGSGFVSKKNGVARTQQYASTPTEFTKLYTYTDAATGSDALTLDYVPGNIEDLNGNPMVAFSNRPVTNNLSGGGSGRGFSNGFSNGFN